MQSKPARLREQVEEIAPLQRIATGEHDVRRTLAGCKTLEETMAFSRRQLARVRIGNRFGTAVVARKVAGAGHFPIHPQRALVDEPVRRTAALAHGSSRRQAPFRKGG